MEIIMMCFDVSEEYEIYVFKILQGSEHDNTKVKAEHQSSWFVVF